MLLENIQHNKGLVGVSYNSWSPKQGSAMIWKMDCNSLLNLSLNATKPIFGVSDKARLKTQSLQLARKLKFHL